MSEKVTITASVVDKKLEFTDAQRRYLVEVIRRWSNGPVSVTVKRERPDKSQLQMGYYRGLVLPMIVEHICGDPEDEEELRRTHRTLKGKFLPSDRVEVVDDETGEVRVKELMPSLADLNTVEMSTFTEKVREWARTFLSLETPDPDPAWRQKRAKVPA